MRKIPITTVHHHCQDIIPMMMLKRFIFTVLISSIAAKYYFIETKGKILGTTSIKHDLPKKEWLI